MCLQSRLATAALIGLTAACLPAIAEENPAANVNTAAKGSKGAVAQLAMAQEIYLLGLANKDALTVLTAAKLAAGVDVKQVEQKKETTGSEPAGQEPAGQEPAGQQDGVDAPIDAAAMMTSARTLAGEDETLAGLIEDAAAEASRGRISGANSTLSRLSAGQTDVWEVPFYGDSSAEIAVLGDGESNLDVLVTDDKGNTICYDVGWTDKIYCEFVPAWNGYFTVKVQNNGTARNSYMLITN